MIKTSMTLEKPALVGQGRREPNSFLACHARWRWYEIAIFVALSASWFALPDNSLVANETVITAIFAISLDLILGYCGVVSLGHAAFFGLGAYAAGLFAKHVMHDPILGLTAAAALSGFFGLLTSVLILRGTDLTRLMVTLGVSSIAFELANKFDDLTGGADGLQGIIISPLLGMFEFDLKGRTAFAYSLVVLIGVLFFCRNIVKSPFGMSLQAIRDNRLRAAAVGISVNQRLVAAYTLSALIAGMAGALSAQTSGFASLDGLDFHRSADVLLVLVIGGAGYLYGGLLGAIAFKLIQEVLSTWTPQYWTFWIGLILVVLVFSGRDRIAATLLNRQGGAR